MKPRQNRSAFPVTGGPGERRHESTEKLLSLEIFRVFFGRRPPEIFWVLFHLCKSTSPGGRNIPVLRPARRRNDQVRRLVPVFLPPGRGKGRALALPDLGFKYMGHERKNRGLIKPDVQGTTLRRGQAPALPGIIRACNQKLNPHSLSVTQRKGGGRKFLPPLIRDSYF